LRIAEGLSQGGVGLVGVVRGAVVLAEVGQVEVGRAGASLGEVGLEVCLELGPEAKLEADQDVLLVEELGRPFKQSSCFSQFLSQP